MSFGELGIIEAADQFLPYGALIVLAGGLVSTLSALNATTFAASRVSFAMGVQYNLPHIFSKIHPKYHTPFVATIISGVIMLILAVSMDLTAIAFAASVMFLFLFTQVNLASITIRRLYASTVEYGFKTPLFPLIPILGILTAAGTVNLPTIYTSRKLDNCHNLDINWFCNLQILYIKKRIGA